MTDDEKEHVATIVELSVNKAVMPMMREISGLHQTLHGANGLDGEGSVVGDLILTRKKYTRIVTFSAVAQGLMFGLGAWFHGLFDKH